jgi:Asp-tRNA(Asn)/Glu-tRNA(Gln) amidotransferase A subunit family amidase
VTPAEYAGLTAVNLRRGIGAGDWSVQEITQAALDRIAEFEPRVHAWKYLEPQAALATAARIEASARDAPLGGVPIAVKDIIATADMPTEYGSPIYRGFRPGADADCVVRVRAAGAVVIGKTVTTEFAYFAPGPTANPRNPAHTPGGSSSGSAAAVACGMVPLAFGTQTAGSLIRPASYCGVFALKPSFAAFALGGVKPFAPSLDTLGWLARSADDLELMRCAMGGEAFRPLEVVSAASVRLGICHTNEWSACDASGADAFERGAGLAAGAGFSLHERELPAALTGLVDAQKTVMAYEAALALSEEAQRHAGQLSAPLSELLKRGRDTPVDDYRAALALTTTGRATVRDCMKDIDALLAPAAPGEAPSGLAATGDPIFSRVWTLLGLPCVNIPALTGARGLPIGLQLVGHPGRERELLIAALALGRALNA